MHMQRMHCPSSVRHTALAKSCCSLHKKNLFAAGHRRMGTTTVQSYAEHTEVTDLAAAQLSQGRKGAPTLDVYYRSGWQNAVIHGAFLGGTWQDYPMQPVPSGGGKWHHRKFDLSGSGVDTNGAHALLEFVVTNKQGGWDKPADGGNYTITSSGTAAVAQGQVNQVTGKRVMVVSDLDGTMVGDDTATKTFRQWWEDTAVPRGGVLVYNTGRVLSSFEQLLKDKAHCLAHPDALISAVGTKVCEFDGRSWHEDQEWSSQLNVGWDISVARDAAYKALAEVGKDIMHFRPKEEQNDHKVTCGLQHKVMDQVLRSINDHLASKNVTANIITSGHGEWRFLDIVPKRAGKLAALQWVAKRYSFATEEVVACGDSGNDILMLEGENPAIVVGNAQADLQSWYNKRRQQEPASNGPRGKPRLLMTTKHEALGILEGLETWGFK